MRPLEPQSLQPTVPSVMFTGNHELGEMWKEAVVACSMAFPELAWTHRTTILRSLSQLGYQVFGPRIEAGSAQLQRLGPT